MNATKAILPTAFLILALGCASQGEPKTIIQGGEGRLAYCVDVKLPAIEQLKACINGERTRPKSPPPTQR